MSINRLTSDNVTLYPLTPLVDIILPLSEIYDLTIAHAKSIEKINRKWLIQR